MQYSNLILPLVHRKVVNYKLLCVPILIVWPHPFPFYSNPLKHWPNFQLWGRQKVRDNAREREKGVRKTFTTNSEIPLLLKVFPQLKQMNNYFFSQLLALLLTSTHFSGIMSLEQQSNFLFSDPWGHNYQTTRQQNSFLLCSCLHTISICYKC